MERRRVVITGISAITPLGLDAASSWQALLAGKSGIERITLFDTTGYDTHIAGEVKGFRPEDVIPAKVCKRMDRFVQFAVCGADQLMKDSGYSIDEQDVYKRQMCEGLPMPIPLWNCGWNGLPRCCDLLTIRMQVRQDRSKEYVHERGFRTDG